MDQRRFDSLARSLATPKTRRGFLGGLAALAVGVRAGSAGQTANAKGKLSCPAGTDPCPDGCFDLKRDPAHCGSCGGSCQGGSCVKGQCRCPAGSVLCGGVCRSQASFAGDGANCGGCGIACDDANACTFDACVGGVCRHAPVSCDDGNPCTVDTCDPVLGCQRTPNTGPCTAEGGAVGTCSDQGVCVPNTTTTTTTTTTTPPGCATAADCPPPTGFTCSFATCTAGVCGFAPYLSGTVCRPSAGPCDFAETCNGSSLDCPPDRFAAQGVACCPGGGSCQTFSACTGASPDCPPLEP